MAAVDVAPNIPVQFSIANEFLTWAVFAYPLAFLEVDITNRVYGPAVARRVVYFVFDRLRAGVWWRAPLASTLVGSVRYKALSSTIALSAGAPFF